MMNKTLRLLLVCSLFGGSVLGPLPARAATAPEAASAPSGSEKLREGEKIDVGDVLDVFVFPQAELNGKLPVLEDGSVAMPTVGRLQVSGLTQAQAVELINKELGKYFVNAKLTLGVIKFNRRMIFITGLVGRPGPVAFREGMKLTEAVTQAGGFTRDSDRRNVRIFRGEPGKRSAVTVDVGAVMEGGDPSLDAALEMGDLIEVPLRRDIVFIWGAVGTSGQVDYIPEMRLHDLVARANGLGTYARRRECRIFHLDGTFDKVDFQKVLDGEPAHNVLIRPGDIVYFPPLPIARANELLMLAQPWFSLVGVLLTVAVLARQ